MTDYAPRRPGRFMATYRTPARHWETTRDDGSRDPDRSNSHMRSAAIERLERGDRQEAAERWRGLERDVRNTALTNS